MQQDHAGLGADLNGYFSAYGWNFHFDGVERWTSGWVENGIFFPMEAVASSQFYLFSVKLGPIYKFLSEKISKEIFFEHLLRLNSELKLAKFTYEINDELLLSIHFLKIGFQYENFELVVGLLHYYTEAYFLEMQALQDKMHLPSGCELRLC